MAKILVIEDKPALIHERTVLSAFNLSAQYVNDLYPGRSN